MILVGDIDAGKTELATMPSLADPSKLEHTQRCPAQNRTALSKTTSLRCPCSFISAVHGKGRVSDSDLLQCLAVQMPQGPLMGLAQAAETDGGLTYDKRNRVARS